MIETLGKVFPSCTAPTLYAVADEHNKTNDVASLQRILEAASAASSEGRWTVNVPAGSDAVSNELRRRGFTIAHNTSYRNEESSWNVSWVTDR